MPETVSGVPHPRSSNTGEPTDLLNLGEASGCTPSSSKVPQDLTILQIRSCDRQVVWRSGGPVEQGSATMLRGRPISRRRGGPCNGVWMKLSTAYCARWSPVVGEGLVSPSLAGLGNTLIDAILTVWVLAPALGLTPPESCPFHRGHPRIRGRQPDCQTGAILTVPA